MIREFLTSACVLVGVVGLGAAAEPPAASAPLEAAFSAMAGKTGDDYLAARARFLALEKSAVVPFLEAKHAAASDQVERLQIQALLARVRDTERADKALADAIAEAGKDRGLMLSGRPVPPMPGQGAALLIDRLGDDAAPLATELFTRGLTDGWERWKRNIPLCALDLLGSRATPGRERTPVRDWRAGWALLWIAEHEKDEEIADYACGGLQEFPSEELIQDVQSLVQNTTSDVVKRRLRDAPRYLRHLKEYADAQAGATRPTATRRSGVAPMTQPARGSVTVELPGVAASRPTSRPADSRPAP